MKKGAGENIQGKLEVEVSTQLATRHATLEYGAQHSPSIAEIDLEPLPRAGIAAHLVDKGRHQPGSKKPL